MQLFMQIYLLLLHTSFMALVLSNKLKWVTEPKWELDKEVIDRLHTAAIINLIVGWLFSLPLFLFLYRNTAREPFSQANEYGKERTEEEIIELRSN